MLLQVSVDDTYDRLKRIAAETGRGIEELAAAAVSDEALQYFAGVRAPERKGRVVNVGYIHPGQVP